MDMFFGDSKLFTLLWHCFVFWNVFLSTFPVKIFFADAHPPCFGSAGFYGCWSLHNHGIIYR